MNRFALLFAISLLGLASSALAQSAKELSVVRFYPAAGPGNYLAVEGARFPERATPSLSAWFDFAADVLELDHPCQGLRGVASCDDQRTSFVPAVGLLHVTAAASVAGRLQLSLDVPLGFTDASPFDYQVQTRANESPSREIGPRQGFALADTLLAAKLGLLGRQRGKLGLALSAFSTLPSAAIQGHADCKQQGACGFVGERGVIAGGSLIVEAHPRSDLRMALNAGGAYRPARRFLTATTASELRYGAGIHYAWIPKARLTAEVAGAYSPRGDDTSPLEARGAFILGQDLAVSLGGGASLYRQVTGPAYRVFLGILWSPTYSDRDGDGIEDRDDRCPAQAEDRDGFEDLDGCPDDDNDRDGVPDAKDACDDEPEDVDGFLDEDGCPELDNDGDGVQDGYDSCPTKKEDVDGDRDDDGCPDDDRDRDGVPDDRDACPDRPEDTDGLADEDGCAESDFDQDGIEDELDACPTQPESINGLNDEDGCPERDADGDGVPDDSDRCPSQSETLNGRTDADGCDDGPAVLLLDGGRLLFSRSPRFSGLRLNGRHDVRRTLEVYLKQHPAAKLRVVLRWSSSDRGFERLQALVAFLAQRLSASIEPKLIEGAPGQLAFELESSAEKPPVAP